MALFSHGLIMWYSCRNMKEVEVGGGPPAEILLSDGGRRRVDAVRAFGRVALCDPRHLQLHHFDLTGDTVGGQ